MTSGTATRCLVRLGICLGFLAAVTIGHATTQTKSKPKTKSQPKAKSKSQPKTKAPAFPKPTGKKTTAKKPTGAEGCE